MSKGLTEQDSEKLLILLETELYTCQETVVYFDNKYTANQIKYYIKTRHPEKLSLFQRETSKGGVKLEYILQQLFPDVPIKKEFHVGNKLRLDFYIGSPYNLGFEFDGIQHHRFTPGLHKTMEDFIAAQERDKDKDKLCKGRGISLIRISYKDLLTVESLREKIDEAGYGSGTIQEGFHTGKEKRKHKQKELNKQVSVMRKKQYEKYKKSKTYQDQKERAREARKAAYQRQKEFARKAKLSS